VRDIKAIASKVPPHASASIVVKLPETAGRAAGGAFTGVKDIEIAQVRQDGRTLKARIRNGLPDRLDDITATITLLGKDGKALVAKDLAVGSLQPGEERDLSADLGDQPPAWTGFETGWKSGK
jgi:hypothetical protein